MIIKYICIFTMLIISNTYAYIPKHINVVEKEQNNIYTLHIKNNSDKDMIMYPAYISNIKNKNIEILEDNCAYSDLKEQCSISFLSSSKKNILILKDLLSEENFKYRNDNLKVSKKKIKKLTEHITIDTTLYKSKKYAKFNIALGKKYTIIYKSKNPNLFFQRNKGPVQNMKKVFLEKENLWKYSLEFLPSQERLIEILIDNFEIGLNFILKEPEEFRFSSNTFFKIPKELSLITSYTRGFPKKYRLHKSLYKIDYSEFTRDNKYSLKETKIINVKTYKGVYPIVVHIKNKLPFGENTLLIEKGSTQTINLDLGLRFSKIINNGILYLESSSNLSLLIAKNIVNNGVILFKKSNKNNILLNELNFIYDEDEPNLKLTASHFENKLYINTLSSDVEVYSLNHSRVEIIKDIKDLVRKRDDK